MNKQEQFNKIGIVYAGGTISSFATEAGYRIGGIKVDLMSKLQEHLTDSSIENIIVTSSDFAYTGLSENIDISDQNKIASKVNEALQKNPHSVLVTHGTDSMEHTARFLQAEFQKKLIQNNQKIILTGANHDIAYSQTDAWDNLQFALLSGTKNEKAGVYVAFHNKLIPADHVVKEPYDGIEMNYVDVRDNRFHNLLHQQNQKVKFLLGELEQYLPINRYPHSVIQYHANRIVNDHSELISQITEKTQAVLFTLYHSGTANTQNPQISLPKLTEKLRRENGILSFAVSENGESIDLHLYETSIQLREAGMIPLYNMLGPVAKEKLIRLSNLSSPQIILQMLTNLCGEIDESKIYHDDIANLIQHYNN